MHSERNEGCERVKIEVKLYVANEKSREEYELIPIPFSDLTLTSNANTVPDMRFTTKKRYSKKTVNNKTTWELDEGDTVIATIKVTKKRSQELARGHYFLSKELGESVEDIFKISNQSLNTGIAKKISNGIDSERVFFWGEIFSKTNSGKNNLTVAAISPGFEFRKMKMPIFFGSDSNEIFKNGYHASFRGYPMVLTPTNLSIEAMSNLQEALQKQLNEMKNFESAKNVQGYDEKIFRKVMKYDLNQMKWIKFDVNALLSASLSGTLTNFLEMKGNLDTDYLTFWNRFLKVYSMEMVFSQYPLTFTGDSGSAMIVKPIFDEFEPVLINSFYEHEISSASAFKNFFREKTRLLLSLYASSSVDSLPFMQKSVIVDKVNGDYTYSIKDVELDETYTKVGNTHDGNMSEQEEKVLDEVNQIYFKQNVANGQVAEGEQNKFFSFRGVGEPIKMSALEKKKGINSMVVEETIADLSKHTANAQNGDSVNTIKNNSGLYLKTNDGKTREQNKTIARNSFEPQLKRVALQKMQDAIIGERNFSAQVFFAPFSIAGLSAGASYDGDVYYGRLEGVTTTITPHRISSQVSYSRVANGEMNVINTYEELGIDTYQKVSNVDTKKESIEEKKEKIVLLTDKKNKGSATVSEKKELVSVKKEFIKEILQLDAYLNAKEKNFRKSSTNFIEGMKKFAQNYGVSQKNITADGAVESFSSISCQDLSKGIENIEVHVWDFEREFIKRCDILPTLTTVLNKLKY